MARIDPVVQVVMPVTARFWVPLPSVPWPAFVRLSGDCSDEELGLVVLTLATYGRSTPPATSRELVEDFPIVAPGGLSVSDGTESIHPGCCCGLEGWREWRRLLDGGQGPWLGHDPAPWVERNGDSFTVWSDGGLLPVDEDGLHGISFTRAELARSLEGVESDLLAHASRLERWLSSLDVAEAGALAGAFRRTFIEGA